ncbi:MAG: NAD(P)H-dependent glycerol-3-phosphate dehydrogenase [Salinisphaeraceae bacterium]|nr:NAD(P)H-dependent glycerol-3-phosphate dehydrogenase [Salinisphaeraceae bacterium]
MSEQANQQTNKKTVAVLGAGSYGTALAIQLARAERPVLLWGRDAEAIAAMAQARENSRYLPDCEFPDSLEPVSDLNSVLERADDIVLAVPSHSIRQMLETIQPMLNGQRLACAAKGLEPGTGRLLDDVMEDVLGKDYPVAFIAGPTFALEVGQGTPTAVTVAARDEQLAKDFAAYFHHHGFRAYTQTDVVGVEIGGAVKNVLAIGVGIADGLGAGANTRALMITRGLAEMMRLAEALGGHGETMMGLAGIGDLVLTCTDDQSRNRRMGLALAKGKTVEEAQEEIGQVVEGVRVAAEVWRLAQQYQVEMPICEQVYRILHEGQPALLAARVLADRPQRAELE